MLSLSADEQGYLEQLFEKIAEPDAGRRLSDWERGFLGDQISRHRQYGEHMVLSHKQWAILKKIGKVYDIPPLPEEDDAIGQ